MTTPIHRRSFIKGAAAAGAAVAVSQVFPVPNILRAANTGGKLNCAVIGCGGRGRSHLNVASKENLVAVVDPDEKRAASALESFSGSVQAQAFGDYREMFDKVGKTLDAVFIATPNHHHALPAMIAMQLGKGVYCEKPLCHNVGEARKLSALAAKHKVPTQMGNQGHCMEGYRRLCEFVWGGVIGNVTATHSWTNRANGGRGPRPDSEPTPAGINWDSWIGPAPYRDYHVDLHPHEWHGWYDFGNGSLGNLACHVMDGVYWALKLEHAQSIEVEEIHGGTDERCPTGTTIRWDFPARGDMPPLQAYWHDGRHGDDDPGDGNHFGPKGAKGPQNFPPLLLELKKQYPDEKFDSSGTLYVGDKGIIYTGTYGNNMRVLPKTAMKDVDGPPTSLPRPKSSFADFLRACREGTTDTATSFDYAARLTEFTLLGNLAQRAGKGKKVEWDGPNMKVTNIDELNRFVSRENREGWRFS